MTQGGFGGGSWGGGPWGGSGADFVAEFDGVESLAVSESLSVYLPLRVVAAVPLSPTLVELTFSHPLDPAYASHVNVANYTILPSLQVLSAALGPDPRTIRIQTAFQAPSLYTVTVGAARSAQTDLIDPPFRSASFAGPSVAATFVAAAQGPRKVMLTFSQPMLQDAALTSIANFSVRAVKEPLAPDEFSGDFSEDYDAYNYEIPITSVVTQGTGSISHLTLNLGADLQKWDHYVAMVDIDVKTETGLSVVPGSYVFQWMDMSAVLTQGPLVIPIQSFSGEVSGGLHGTPAGQIFFSPALTTSAANSVIQVEEVSVCTRAYDVYEFPNPPDPVPFFLQGNGAPAGALGSLANVLWAPAPRLGQARVDLSDKRSDTLQTPIDALSALILREPIDITQGGFLNDSRWPLAFPLSGDLFSPDYSTEFDSVTPLAVFTVFNNLAPVGPGPTVATVFPTDYVQVSDSVTTVTSWALSSTDTVAASDTVGIEITRSMNDAVSAVDAGDVMFPPSFTEEFDAEFE